MIRLPRCRIMASQRGTMMDETQECSCCPAQQVCPWGMLGVSDRKRLMQVVSRPGVYRAGRRIYHAGESLGSLFVLRSGCVKAWNVTDAGDEYVIRFHMPGDVLGLAGICSGAYDSSAMALDTCSLCEMPYAKFQRMAERVPALNLALLRMMSHQIQEEERTTLLRGHRSAPAKLSAFLCRLADSFVSRGFSGTEFNLSMGRREIADYLGLALETVSRTLTQLDHEGALSVRGRHIEVRNRERLDALARCVVLPESVGGESTGLPAGQAPRGAVSGRA